MEKNCKNCFWSCRIRGYDFARKLGCLKHFKKVNATEVHDDCFLLVNSTTVVVGLPEEGKSMLPRFSSMEKKAGEAT